jgi:hypothetical protein
MDAMRNELAALKANGATPSLEPIKRRTRGPNKPKPQLQGETA